MVFFCVRQLQFSPDRADILLRNESEARDKSESRNMVCQKSPKVSLLKLIIVILHSNLKKV